MKTNKYIFCFTLLLTTSLHAQFTQDKVCVKEFYRILTSCKEVSISNFSRVYCNASPDYEAGLLVNIGKLSKNDYFLYQKEIASHSDTIESKILSRMRTYKNQLTKGLNYENICKQIEVSSIYNEGTDFSVLLELKLTERDIIFFELNKDTPKQIQYIWLSSGESLGNLVLGDKVIETFRRPGIINDQDGYSNIREKPDKSSKVVGKLIKDDIFYYTPTNESDWWAVYKDEGGKLIGYIHKSRILRYINFPPELKEKVKKQRSGCL
jgi:hypothetical protein